MASVGVLEGWRVKAHTDDRVQYRILHGCRLSVWWNGQCDNGWGAQVEVLGDVHHRVPIATVKGFENERDAKLWAVQRSIDHKWK